MVPLLLLAALGGYHFEVKHDELVVTKGKQRARLAQAMDLVRVKVDDKARAVDIDVEDVSCDGSQHYRWTFGQLDARLENTTAFGLHKKRDFKRAAQGFARAVAADPTWNVAAYNLASAHQLRGDKRAATAALAPWLAAEPIATYVKVTTDPELAPLLGEPELAAVRSKQPGNVALTATGELTGGVAYAANRKLLAVVRKEASWGACSFTNRLEIYDRTGVLVASTAIVNWDETDTDCSGGVLKSAKGAIATRSAQLSTMLANLGFNQAATEPGTLKTDTLKNGDVKHRLQFPANKLGVVSMRESGTASVLRSNTVLATGKVLDSLTAGIYVGDVNAIIVWSIRAGREGCEGSDPTQVTIIQL